MDEGGFLSPFAYADTPWYAKGMEDLGQYETHQALTDAVKGHPGVVYPWEARNILRFNDLEIVDDIPKQYATPKSQLDLSWLFNKAALKDMMLYCAIVYILFTIFQKYI